MSEYVDIRTSVADILNTANNLQSQGQNLTKTMSDAVDAINRIESDPETLPKDEFTDGFLENYHAQVPTDSGSVTANVAVKLSALQLGQALTHIGEAVSKAMWGYSGADDENAADVNSAGNV